MIGGEGGGRLGRVGEEKKASLGRIESGKMTVRERRLERSARRSTVPARFGGGTTSCRPCSRRSCCSRLLHRDDRFRVPDDLARAERKGSRSVFFVT